MNKEKKALRQARQTLKDELQAGKQTYQANKQALDQTYPSSAHRTGIEQEGYRQAMMDLKADRLNHTRQAQETYAQSIAHLSPRHLSAKDIKHYRLPQAKERLSKARQEVSRVKAVERRQTKAVPSKFLFGRHHQNQRQFSFKSAKTLDRLQADKALRSAKREVKALKRAHKAKRLRTKARWFGHRLGSEAIDVLAQDSDLEGLAQLKETSRKTRRYTRLATQTGKGAVKTGQETVRVTKQGVRHTMERYRNLTQGRGWTISKPLKPKRRYQTFLRRLKQRVRLGAKGLFQALRQLLAFFTAVLTNPVTWLVTGLLGMLLLVMSFVIGFMGTNVIHQDEFDLTESYTHLTWLDAENTRTSDKGITYYTNVDDVMVFMNHRYQDYRLDVGMEESAHTYRTYLGELWTALNGGESIKSMKDLYETPTYKVSKDDQEEMAELTEEGRYVAMQELDNPFQGQTEEDTLTMSYRYGYYALDGQPTLQNHIILDAKAHQVIVAPMDGKVSLEGDDVILTSGKGRTQARLTLFQIANGRVKDGHKVLSGEVIGQTKEASGLKVSYQKYDEDKGQMVFVNPAFYFPRVVQLQTTILPHIGQFGGDEFARAKHIYEFLKKKGASNQAIAAILGNWSVESSINPKRAEGDYLALPVGASDTSWDDEAWLGMGGPAIYNGRYPNILRRGLGLGQWTDTADGSRRHTMLVTYAKEKGQKWYDLDLQLAFMLEGDTPYYRDWLKDFFQNTGSPASLAQLFLTYWEGNSGDKLLERQTRATEWFYQIENGFSQPNGGTAQSDPKALEAVRGDLYEGSIPGGGDGMGYAYGQCTWGVAARMNQLGLKLKGKNGEAIDITSTMGNGQDWVRTAQNLGGETGSTPKEGAIISFVGGTHGTLADYGHVAFVEKVYSDGSFLISETNVNGNPNYTFRKLSSADGYMSFAYTMK